MVWVTNRFTQARPSRESKDCCLLLLQLNAAARKARTAGRPGLRRAHIKDHWEHKGGQNRHVPPILKASRYIIPITDQRQPATCDYALILVLSQYSHSDSNYWFPKDVGADPQGAKPGYPTVSVLPPAVGICRQVIGGTLGRLIGELLAAHLGESWGVVPSTFALVGAAGISCGATQTISAAVVRQHSFPFFFALGIDLCRPRTEQRPPLRDLDLLGRQDVFLICVIWLMLPCGSRIICVVYCM